MTMKKRTFWLLAGGIALAAVGAAAVGLFVVLMRSGGGSFGGRAYLELTLEGLPERPRAGLPFERESASLGTYVQSLDQARQDQRVTAVVLRANSLGDAGWARVQELRDAVLRFRKSGKPVYAHLESCGNDELYLASAADKIYAVPTALIGLTGLASEVTFLRGSLEKLGVEAQFESIGEYKNAPNQFTEKSFTPPHREQTEGLLDSLDRQFVEALARGRGRTPAQVREWIDAGPYDARDAQRLGLIDELLYRDQLEARLEGASRVTPLAYARGASGFSAFGRPRIALIYALGDIAPGRSASGALGGESAGSDTLSAALREARSDDGVRAVVLRIDSPGGSGQASDVIWREVRETRRKKPVIAPMGDLAASGGYYVAMGADVLVAQPGTITGSIGVFSGKFSLRGLYDKIGLSRETVARGRHATLFSDYHPWDASGRAKVHDLMAAFYRDFVGKAAEHRGKTYEQADALARGRVWSGQDALERGLVDRLGGLDAAIEVAKEKAGLRADQSVTLVVLPARKGLLELLLERQEEAEAAAAAAVLPRPARALLHWATVVGSGPVARLPFDLRVY